MSQQVRAIVEQGKLRVLEAVNMPDGAEVVLTVLTPLEHIREALRDILVPQTETDLDEIDENELQRWLDERLQGVPPLSQAILDERYED